MFFCYKCRLYQISKLTIWFIFGVAIQYTKGDGKMEQYKSWCEKIEQQIKQNNIKTMERQLNELVHGIAENNKIQQKLLDKIALKVYKYILLF